MENKKNLEESYQEIRDILWNVYGIGSLHDGNDIVLYRDGESLGRFDARLGMKAICCGSTFLYFYAPAAVHCVMIPKSTLVLSSIKKLDEKGEERKLNKTNENGEQSDKKGEERKISIRNENGDELDVKISSGHMCISKTTYSKDKSTPSSKEFVSMSFTSSSNFCVGHVAADYGNNKKTEPYNYSYTPDSIESKDAEKRERLTSFVTSCMTVIGTILPNRVDTFLELADPIMYDFFRTSVLGQKEKEDTTNLESEASRQYSKQFFTPKANS